MKEIILTRSHVAKVDDDVYEWASKYKWYILSVKYPYVIRPRAAADPERPKSIYLHRQILNASKGEYVDHINRDKLDNRTQNLRICTHQENLLNRGTGKRKNGGSLKGASKPKKSTKWRADLTFNRKQIHLGMFDTELEAHMAYVEKYKEVHGKYTE